MFVQIHLKYDVIMIKKSILVGILLSSTLACTAFCQEFIAMALSIPTSQQDSRNQDTPTASAASQSPMTLDRSGMDKASVHLQILQQSTSHFSDSVQAKKPAADDKKLQLKPQSNS
jgi:hypothetical protein